jgi:hypothetical protein
MPREPKRPDDLVPEEQTAMDAVSEADTASAPQGNGPNVGDTVICTNRLPSPLRPWENPIWIGVIEEPGTDPSRWSGRYSEAAFCKFSKRRRVRYRNPDDANDSFVQHDKADSLIVLSEDEAKLSGLDAIRHFLGLVAAHQYERHATAEPKSS